jgi:hypothetical protein
MAWAPMTPEEEAAHPGRAPFLREAERQRVIAAAKTPEEYIAAVEQAMIQRYRADPDKFELREGTILPKKSKLLQSMHLWGPAAIIGGSALGALPWGAWFGGAGAGTASVSTPTLSSLNLGSLSGSTAFPGLGPGWLSTTGSLGSQAAGPIVGGGLTATTAVPAVAPLAAKVGGKAMGWRDILRQGWDVLSSPEAEALGKVAQWGTGLAGDRRREEILADDKLTMEQRYQEMLALNAKQRAEDLQLDADREAKLEARWQAQQDQIESQWLARETRMEPYREAGRQSLARVANLQTPTRTPYRSRFMRG